MKKLAKRAKPAKREFRKVVRQVHRNRTQPARVFRVKPDPGRPFIVEVRIARSRPRMFDEMRRIDNAKPEDMHPRCMGLVRHWFSLTNKRMLYRPRLVVARMYLNARDLRAQPSTIVPHECAHAAMAWARLQRANLAVMPGEEVLAHAVGDLVRQVNVVCFAMGVWP